MSSLPSGLNLKIWWPLFTAGAGVAGAAPRPPAVLSPARPPPLRPPPPVHAQSVTHTLPSRSTWIPCGAIRSPAPKCATTVPVESNFRIGSRLEVAQLFVLHRSAIQILVPFLSMSTALVEPQVRPSGSLAHV